MSRRSGGGPGGTGCAGRPRRAPPRLSSPWWPAVALASPRGPAGGHRPLGTVARRCASQPWYLAGPLPAADARPRGRAVRRAYRRDRLGGSASVTDAFTGRATGAESRGGARCSRGCGGGGRPDLRPGRALPERSVLRAAASIGRAGVVLGRLFTLPVRAVPTFAVSPDAPPARLHDRARDQDRFAGDEDGPVVDGRRGAGLRPVVGRGSTVAFEWNTPIGGNRREPGCGSWTWRRRLPGPLMASRLLIASCRSSSATSQRVGPLLTPDGSKVFVTSIALGRATSHGGRGGVRLAPGWP